MTSRPGLGDYETDFFEEGFLLTRLVQQVRCPLEQELVGAKEGKKVSKEAKERGETNQKNRQQEEVSASQCNKRHALLETEKGGAVFHSYKKSSETRGTPPRNKGMREKSPDPKQSRRKRQQKAGKRLKQSSFS